MTFKTLGNVTANIIEKLAPKTSHEWLTIGRRRWCMGCDAFQIQKDGQWHGSIRSPCPQWTPYAKSKLIPKVESQA